MNSFTGVFQRICSDFQNTWVKVFKNAPSKICGRQPLKNSKGYGQTLSLQIF